MRPYASFKIDELERLARDKASNSDVISAIRSELSHRTTSRAERLATQLDARSAGSNKHEQKRAGTEGRDRKPENSNAALEAKIAELMKALNEKIEALRKLEFRANGLEVELQNLRRKNSADGSSSGPYAIIGVLDTMPDFAIDALRKAFQKAYHPDICKDMHGTQAHDRFVRVMGAFDRIEASRRKA
jgi:hypothetical protein